LLIANVAVVVIDVWVLDDVVPWRVNWPPAELQISADQVARAAAETKRGDERLAILKLCA
jgi:hypothetical protein